VANPSSEQPLSGSIPFRPLAIGDIFTGLLRTVKMTWRVLLVVGLIVGFIAGLLSLVVTFISALLGISEFEQRLSTAASEATTNEELLAAFDEISENLGIIILGFTLALISALIMQVISTGVITHIAADAVLGRKILSSEAWVRIRPRVFGLVGLALVVFAFAITGAAIAVVPIILVSQVMPNVTPGLLIIGLIAALMLVVIVSVRLTFTAPIYILEQTTIAKALSRSNQLVAGSSWRVFGYIILSSLLAQILGSVFSAPTQSAAIAVSTSNPDSSTATFLATLSTIISTAVALPVTATILTLLYTDLRIRKENFAEELKRASEN